MVCTKRFGPRFPQQLQRFVFSQYYPWGSMLCLKPMSARNTWPDVTSLRATYPNFGMGCCAGVWLQASRVDVGLTKSCLLMLSLPQIASDLLTLTQPVFSQP